MDNSRARIPSRLSHVTKAKQSHTAEHQAKQGLAAKSPLAGIPVKENCECYLSATVLKIS